MIAQGPNKSPTAALAANNGDGVLAIITGVVGPSYRPVGACMAILAGQERVGSLSSGCIESDIVLHAAQVLISGQPRTVKYGQGSPYIDIKLPCGGGLEILLVPRPDRRVLAQLTQNQIRRQPCTLNINSVTGAMDITAGGGTAKNGDVFSLRLLPEPFFYVFGKGPEASTFTDLVQSAGYRNLLLSPDPETLNFGQASGCEVRHLKQPGIPAEIHPDPWSAIILFFHDHEWEPPILKDALASDAFYIGAQGSQRARDARMKELELLCIDRDDIVRLRGPIGLIPSVRDARTLAVSVLAEVLNVAHQHWPAGKK